MAYDNRLRQARAAETRQRMIEAGAALARELPSWNWKAITFRAVAERTGTSERTVYRHFATQQALHDAVMRQLGVEAGVSYDDLSLSAVPDVMAKVFASLPQFRTGGRAEVARTQAAEDRRRREALLAALEETSVDDAPRAQAAAVLDVLWSVEAHRRLVSVWHLSNEDAIEAVRWAVDTLSDALRDGRVPSPGATPSP